MSRSSRLSRIILDLEELKEDCWHSHDVESLERLITQANAINLTNYED